MIKLDEIEYIESTIYYLEGIVAELKNKRDVLKKERETNKIPMMYYKTHSGPKPREITFYRLLLNGDVYFETGCNKFEYRIIDDERVFQIYNDVENRYTPIDWIDHITLIPEVNKYDKT